ncbi:aldo/keto reductase [Streptomyces sp. NEAU-H22]|uniref:aldo/keto reductase n=1 Tax=unclassified Streptomyces TaxID=2593676 RepID=UPI00225394D4|nr:MULTISPECIES: aldo/keto reductase [unclassified Streptomyces]MCX3288156.1 aldo/keto reductase [Streptomyces sp. NEAU-H22]WMD07336.1 aldo/keto reductase [Streptomyces sp. FXY-T5]
MATIGQSDLKVFPLCLGGSVFGWTVDQDTSFAVLDAYLEAGGNFIDTADSYSQWAPGNHGGESETVIGRWLATRKVRDQVVIATKVGRKEGLSGLGRKVIHQAVEDSLRRLRTDRIDLYYTHADDPGTPLEETLTAMDALVSAGKVRHIAASNTTADRLSEALAVSEKAGVARFVAVQPPYNLADRDPFERELLPLCVEEGLSCVPYFGLAQGFLTGKHRDAASATGSVRGAAARQYASRPHARALLDTLDRVAEGHAVAPGAVALAWLAAQPSVTAPIASSRTTGQLAELLPGATLRLSAGELQELDVASRALSPDRTDRSAPTGDTAAS